MFLFRINKSYLIASALTVALGVWMLSGRLSGDPGQAAPVPAEKAAPAAAAMTVQVREQHAEPVVRELILHGQTQPDRSVTVRAEIDGKVAEIVAERGQRVAAGEVILRLAPEDRPARLKQAEALLRQRETDYAALQKMEKKGYQAQSQVDQATTDLETARAELERIQLEIERTTIRAPFAGILNERNVEIGDYVASNTELFTIVDNDPMIVRGELPQQAIAQVEAGREGKVRLITGEEAEGSIRYISATASPTTRTFPLELEIANADGSIVAGISAEIRLPLETVATHFISPALLSLNAGGDLGVITVDGNDTVEFHPVSIVRAGADGIWVSGLPETARIITAGQGFVQAGEHVTVLEQEPAAEPVATDPSGALPADDSVRPSGKELAQRQ
jgi:multidrug efflux system membrane fusion protein